MNRVGLLAWLVTICIGFGSAFASKAQDTSELNIEPLFTYPNYFQAQELRLYNRTEQQENTLLPHCKRVLQPIGCHTINKTNENPSNKLLIDKYRFDKLIPGSSRQTRLLQVNGPDTGTIQYPIIPSRIGHQINPTISPPDAYGDFYADKWYWGRGFNHNLELPCPEMGPHIHQ